MALERGIKEKESTNHSSHGLSNQADEEGKTVMEEAAGQCTDRPPESRHAKDTDTEMDPGGITSCPAPDKSSGSGPTSPESKPKPKYAFVKIMELDEKKMLISYLEAFFGESYGVWTSSPPFPV